RRRQNSRALRVRASRRLPGPAWDELDDVELVTGPLTEPRPDVDALVVVAQVVDDRLLDLLPNLRIVANYGVGYDGVDVEACARRGVAVTNTPGVLDAATADLAFALLLAARRRIVEGDRYVRDGRWGTDWAEAVLLAEEVSGATLGIVGLGRIGSAVARRARAFDMRVLYTRRSPDPGSMALDDLLPEADVVR